MHNVIEFEYKSKTLMLYSFKCWSTIDVWENPNELLRLVFIVLKKPNLLIKQIYNSFFSLTQLIKISFPNLKQQFFIL